MVLVRCKWYRNVSRGYPGASAGVATLEAQMTSLQQMADEVRAGDGPLEARTPGIYHMAGGTKTGEVCSGVMEHR